VSRITTRLTTSAENIRSTAGCSKSVCTFGTPGNAQGHKSSIAHFRINRPPVLPDVYIVAFRTFHQPTKVIAIQVEQKKGICSMICIW
jgi:hypothetical protein